jgi:hypothetical protein
LTGFSILGILRHHSNKGGYMRKRDIDRFIPKFNEGHKYTKIMGVKKAICWVLDIKVSSDVDRRKSLCHFYLNVWPESKPEKVSDAINDKYRGLREFLDQHDGLEARVIGKVVTV